jgi:hypothetical protein
VPLRSEHSVVLRLQRRVLLQRHQRGGSQRLRTRVRLGSAHLRQGQGQRCAQRVRQHHHRPGVDHSRLDLHCAHLDSALWWLHDGALRPVRRHRCVIFSSHLPLLWAHLHPPFFRLDWLHHLRRGLDLQGVEQLLQPMSVIFSHRTEFLLCGGYYCRLYFALPKHMHALDHQTWVKNPRMPIDSSTT